MKHWLLGSGLVVLASGIAGGIEGAMLNTLVAVPVAFGTGVLMQVIYVAVTWRQLVKAMEQ